MSVVSVDEQGGDTEGRKRALVTMTQPVVVSVDFVARVDADSLNDVLVAPVLSATRVHRHYQG